MMGKKEDSKDRCPLFSRTQVCVFYFTDCLFAIIVFFILMSVFLEECFSQYQKKRKGTTISGDLADVRRSFFRGNL